MNLPNQIFDSHTALLGKTGSGKSSALRLMIERLLDEKRRVCIIDPKGDHWGIKTSADGKSKGYPVVLFGDFKPPGKGEIPLNAHAGKEMGRLVVEGNRPCVIGFRGWTVGNQTRFWIEFASTVFNGITDPLWLVIDEMQNFAPKGKILSPEAGECLHWSNRLMAEGRGLGLRVLFASQRPQKVHNDTLDCAETLIAMRSIHASVRTAVKEWVDGHGDPERSKEVLNSLAEMKRGEAYVWSPEIQYFERQMFPLFKTYDSFKPPAEGGKTVSPKGWADVDLKAIQERFAATIKEAKENDPAELRREVRRLRAELEKAGRGIPAPKVDVRKEVEDRATAIATQRAAKIEKHYQGIITRVFSKAKELVALTEEVPKAPDLIRPGTMVYTPGNTRIPHDNVFVRPSFTPSKEIGRGVTNPEQRILDAIRWMESIGIEEPSQTAVAFLAGYVYGAGGFNNPRGALRVKGYVDYLPKEKICLTREGRALAKDPQAVLTVEELHRRVMDRLPNPEQRILKPLLDVYPNTLSNEDLAEAASYQAGTGGFNNPRGRLRSLGLIEYVNGASKACDILFPLELTGRR